MVYTSIIDPEVSQDITYFKIVDQLDDCSSSVHIRYILKLVNKRIRLYRINYLIRNRIYELLKYSTSLLTTQMLEHLLEEIEDVDIIFDYKIVDNEMIQIPIEYTVGMKVSMQESRLYLLKNLLNNKIVLKDIPIYLTISYSAVIDNINYLIKNELINLDIKLIKKVRMYTKPSPRQMI